MLQIGQKAAAALKVKRQTSGAAAPLDGYRGSSPGQAAEAYHPSVFLKVANAALGTVEKDDPEVTLAPTMRRINEFEPAMQKLSDAELRAQTDKLKARLKPPDGLNDDEVKKFETQAFKEILPEAFATAREAARRATGMRPRDVQVLAGLVMAKGNIAELATGEGKTLAVTMPAYMYALAGKGAHVITVNETLVQRDAGNMGPIYRALGLTVGAVRDSMTTEEKRQAYNSDVTYLTVNSEGFDYLRDNHTHKAATIVQRKPYAALVDEVDEVLIDESRKPLIIAGESPSQAEQFKTFAHIAKALVPERDFKVEEKDFTIDVEDAGYQRVERLYGVLEGLDEHRQFKIDDHHDVLLPPETLSGLQARLGPEVKLEEGRDFEKTVDPEFRRLTDAGLARAGDRLGVDLFGGADNDLLLGEVQKRQTGEQPVNVAFGSRMEADRFTDYLKQQGVAFEEGPLQAALRQDPKVVGVLYPDGPKPRPGHGPHVLPDIVEAGDFSYASMIAPLTACLRAQTLFKLNKDYVVQERPEWIGFRNRSLMNDSLNDVKREELREATSREAVEVSTQFVHLAAAGGASSLKNTPWGSVLNEWWESSKPAGDDIEIPGEVIDAVTDQLRCEHLERMYQDLPADRKESLEKEAEDPRWRDPEGSIQCVNEYTGRIMPDQRYNDGVHQALEAKEGLAVRSDQSVIAQITLRGLLGQFEHIGGMSGTAKTQEKEFQHLCGMSVIRVRPNQPSQRQDKPDVVFDTKAEKIDWLADQAEAAHKRGQPVLIGTPSIGLNREVAGELDARQIPHAVLNADDVKNNTEAENEILQRAGRVGAVTVATDMAGRGVDIRPDLYDDQRLAEAVAKATQPVAILAVDAHEAQRLAGGQFDKLPILTPGMAAPQGAVVLNEADFATGGLLVLGAERHDSRRIDNQLVGRSGRQGEPGTTQFAVSLDDQVIRDYAPKGLKGWLSHHGKGHEADGRGAHMVKKAQKKVEEVHASQRETTAKYEGPEAIQRQIIYDDRRSILDGHDLTPQILKWAGAAVDTLAEPYQGHGLFHRDGISRDDAMVLADSVHDMFGVTEGLSPEGGSLEHTVTALKDEVHHLYQRRETDAGGPEAMQDKARKVFIDALDKGWSEQIEDLGNLRDGIGYRGLAQVQPEDAYKIEARRLFDEMQVRVESETLENIFRPA